MKKFFLVLVSSACLFRLSAQTEVKVSPIPLLFGYVAASVEQGFNPSFGLDASLYYIEESWGGNLSAKYYFNPEKGIDKFHVGAFLGAQESAPGLGFLLGYKWVSTKNVIFELGGGLGRSFDDTVLGYGKFHIGFRFGKKSKPVIQE